MKRNLLSRQSSVGDFSDSDILNYSPELLSEYEETLKKVSDLVEDSSILQKPSGADTIVRRFLLRTSTLEAKLKYARDDLAKYSQSFENAEEALKKREETIEEKEKTKKYCASIEKENSKISEEIEKIRNSFPSGDNDALISTENEISLLDDEFQKSQNEVSTIKSEIFATEDKFNEEAAKTESIETHFNEAKQQSESNDIKQLSEELAEKRVKRMNIQKALDSLIAESKAKSNARRIVLNQRRSQIAESIEETKKDIEAVTNQRARVSRLKIDVARLEALIAHEEKRVDEPEVAAKKDEPMNKARVSRLVMLLMTDGSSRELISSIGSELNWSKEKMEEMYQMSIKGKDVGIGDEWVAWLDDTTK